MQSKGFIRVITIALILVCAFYLSFSFVSSRYEKKATEYAQRLAGTNDAANDAYKVHYKAYMDSLANEKVYLGRTFQQVREMELGLGLDLKGGMNVTLQISVPDILKALSNQNPDPKFNQAIQITDSLHRDEKDFVGAFCKEYSKLAPGASLYQIFRGIESLKPDASNADVEKALKEEVSSMVDNSYNVLRTRIDGFGVVAPNIQKLENTGRILLELPGVKEPERVRKLLQGTANLEFFETYTINDLQQSLAALSNAYGAAPAEVKADTTATAAPVAENAAVAADSAKVDSAAAPAPAKAEVAKADEKKADEAPARPLADLLWSNSQPGGCVIGIVGVQDTATVNKILRSADAKRLLPSNLKARWSVKSIDEKGRFFSLVALKANQGKAVLTGDVVTDASSDFDKMQGNVVSMTMNDEGARQWARVTQQNLGKAIAIVLDDQVYSYPNVNSVIEGGRSQITGNFTIEEAKDLANVLKSGKMAARVQIASESVIGPSLGKESIQAGVMSFIVALVLLMAFMFASYGFGPGLVANIGLALNLFFTLGILASFQAVLTLPGIAGIVLSLGMAVDANVLIFERTKEELRAGKGVKSAVADGYKNAFSAIFDGNVTTVLTGIILFMNGSGPIKGFATTLIIGIACSFFTALFATRLIMERLLNTEKFKNMTFVAPLAGKLFNNAHFDFIGKRKNGLMVAAALIVVLGGLLGVRGLSRGIDFSGGRNFVVQFNHPVKTAELKASLEKTDLGKGNISVITIDNDTKVRVSTNYKIESGEANVDDEIMGILYKGLESELDGMTYEDFSLSNENLGVVQSEKVGPSIASDMTREAVWAVLLSLLAMALYILIRFRNIAFSIGALAAVAFTAFVIIGFYSLYGMLPFSMEIDQTFIAAILTVIGYQVNDTVVVFDRIRETRTLYPKLDLTTAFNNSLNSTLARTIMTSVSTLLVLVCIFILGGESIRSFIFAMLLGVTVGTFASIFIATPTAFALSNKQAKKAGK